MIEQWELDQLAKKFPEADLSREGAYFTARYPGCETVFRDRSASLTEVWLAHVRDEMAAGTDAAVEFSRRCAHDEEQVAAASPPKPWTE